MIIADGIKGTDETLVPVKNGEYVKEAKIGHALMDADIVISLTPVSYTHLDAGSVLLFDLDELIFAGTKTDLFGVSDAGTPIGIGVRDAEGIMRLVTVQMLVFMPHLLRALGKHGVRKRGLSHCRVGTSLVLSLIHISCSQPSPWVCSCS